MFAEMYVLLALFQKTLTHVPNYSIGLHLCDIDIRF